MEHHIEQYQARDRGVTLHTWTEAQGSKKENFYITVSESSSQEETLRYNRLSILPIVFL
jgi:hypothetical protein